MNLPVSIVITCYNQARFLGAAIESVRLQNPREIIVIDDGSKDDTAEVAARYGEARYIRQENQGVVAARNRGLSECRGEYVVFLDGDDVLLSGALETGTRMLDAAPEAGFIYGRCQMITADGEPLPHTSPVCDGDDLYGALLRRNDIWMPGQVMHRRRALEHVGGFSAAVDHSSDLDLYLRIAREFPALSHDQIIAHWRQHGSNTSQRLILMLRSSLRTMRAQRDYIEKHKRYEEAYRSGLECYRKYYGDLLLDEVREHVRTRRNLRQATEGTLALMWYCPQLLTGYVKQKLSKSLHSAKF